MQPLIQPLYATHTPHEVLAVLQGLANPQTSYDIVRGGWKFVERGTVNVIVDHMMFDYEDFRDLRRSGPAPGAEPFYTFDANVVQVFVSFWF